MGGHNYTRYTVTYQIIISTQRKKQQYLFSQGHDTKVSVDLSLSFSLSSRLLSTISLVLVIISKTCFQQLGERRSSPFPKALTSKSHPTNTTTPLAMYGTTLFSEKTLLHPSARSSLFSTWTLCPTKTTLLPWSPPLSTVWSVPFRRRILSLKLVFRKVTWLTLLTKVAGLLVGWSKFWIVVSVSWCT